MFVSLVLATAELDPSSWKKLVHVTPFVKWLRLEIESANLIKAFTFPSRFMIGSGWGSRRRPYGVSNEHLFCIYRYQ